MQDTHWNVGNMIYGDNPGENPLPDINAIKQSSNLYVYCINDPVNYFDTSGARAGRGTYVRPSLDWSKATDEQMREEICRYFLEASKIGDGEHALIDNYRNQIRGIFHEQWIYWKNKEHDIGGEFGFAFSKAGWNFEELGISQLNFASIDAQVYADVDDDGFAIGVGGALSIWSTDISAILSLWEDYKITISIGLGVGKCASIKINDGLEFISFSIGSKSFPLLSITFYAERIK